jgi:hypothetical protein
MPLFIGGTNKEHWKRSWPAGGPWQD